MEDSFRIWRRNTKSLTWPAVGRSIVVDNCNNNNNSNNNTNNSSTSLSSSSASSIISSSNFGANSVVTDKSVEKKLKTEAIVGHHRLENKSIDISGSVCSGNNIGGSSDVQQKQQQQQQQQNQGAVVTAASVKKKSKRRRNQALCKGKTVQNIRKLSVGPTSNSGGGNKYNHYTHHRNSSPAWDTDFKGCWEMGPDLIKEFLSRQKGSSHKRNRSNSDSMDHEEHNERNILNEMPAKDDMDVKPIMKSYIDLSFCCDDDEYENEFNDDDDEIHQHRNHYTEEGVDYVDEDYDDNTLASVSELAMDSINPKRLYQREGQSQKSLSYNVFISNADGENTLDELTNSVDPLDFEQFKAKFNSSVEALWKDIEPTPTLNTQQQKQSVNTQITDNSLKVNNSLGAGGISSSFYANTSLNALAPFKKDLWNFWSNYNQQNYDQMSNKLSTTASTSSMITTTRLDDSSASSGAGADIANSSDYFSMPSNLDDFDKSVGAVRRTNEAGASLGAHTPPINVFLQNSIWSTSGDCVNAIGTTSVADTDESFLFKVWHSNKKLYQLDVGNSINGEKMPSLVTENDDGDNKDFNKSKESSISNLGASLQLPPYQNLKWSEGINAGPPYSSLRMHANVNHNNEMDSLSNSASLRAENSYAVYNSAANITGATWEAPTYGQNAQPDLKSWCASNPMSLTEMYGNDVCDSIVNQVPEEEHDLHATEMATGPAVTLPNHCANTSGFVAYSRIKQSGLVLPQTKPLQSSSATRLPKDFFRSNEEENLLTSERTHFHPIENFVDGYTFDISNALDTVEFERTPSGLMRYDSEDYLEYTRNDIYMADEEVATNSTNLLKYGRRALENKNEMFVIKFRVKRSGEIACQTEEQDFQLAAAKMAELPTPSSLGSSLAFSQPLEVTNMFHNTFSLSRQANNEAIMAAVTKAVAAAAKAAAESHLNAGHLNWMPTANINARAAATNNSADLENNPLWMPDNSISDEVDFCQIDNAKREKQQQQQLAQNWSMQDVEKQCHLRHSMPQKQQEIKRKYTTKLDIEQRHEDNSLDNTSLHTLWGMCAVCNSCGEYGKSMPANRLLRDELQLEADEIMSDLRYMQDLYIGESGILDENNEDLTTTEVAEDKVYDYINRGMEEIDVCSMNNPWNRDINDTIVSQNDTIQVQMLQKVNQLIEDLLKPENSRKLSKETVLEYDKIAKEIELKNTWNLQVADQNKTKNLWQFAANEEDSNIWQHKHLDENVEGKSNENAEAFMKPMKLLKQVGGSLSEDSQYMETLNWEHDNLAKIWQQTIPTSTQIEETFIKNKQIEMANKIINENLPEETVNEETLLEGSQKQLVEEKNLKNLQHTNALTTPPSSVAANTTYKRVQQFLNNSAAKLKIAANRKRRHSASQNFYQQQHLQYNSSNSSNNNNNNNDNITDLNAYKQKLNDTINAAKEQQEQEQQQQQEVLITNNIKLEEQQQPTKQTIITCKYWTTATNGTQSSLDSATAAMMLLAAADNANEMFKAATVTDGYDQEDVMIEENIFGNTFSCLIDKNASILKHMTMMARPLTR
ncbi:uncharacterized protein ACRADG_006853 isoform 2-T6 [Cochliomyia hominivorax]